MLLLSIKPYAAYSLLSGFYAGTDRERLVLLVLTVVRNLFTEETASFTHGETL
jgi:hypothetical protein